MARKAYIPTAQEIDALYNRAMEGDANARDQLGELNNRIAKRANERMRDIERQGMEGTAAYNRAKYRLGEEGREYFSQSRKIDPDALVENLEAATEYLRSQTSTAAGERARRQNIADSLEEQGFFDDIDSDIPTETLKKGLMDFFDSDAWEDIRKHNRGGTNVLVQEATEALANGAKLGDLKRAFRDFQRGADTDYIEMWDNWTSANTYYRGGAWNTLKRPRR